MLGIGDVRDYIAGLGIADNNNVYCGKLDNKKDKSIGVYNLNRQRPSQTALYPANLVFCAMLLPTFHNKYLILLHSQRYLYHLSLHPQVHQPAF